MIEEWKKIKQDLMQITMVKIPRFVGHNISHLCGFSDASGAAYACAIYVKSEMGCHVTFSKSRIAPKPKKNAKGDLVSLTISKLELIGALIGARALRNSARELRLPVTVKRILWIDSKVVFPWLRSKQTLSVWVRNRVKEILGENDLEFRYIETSFNPSDLPTRGVSTQDLVRCDKWWYGPEFMAKPESNWLSWNYEVLDVDTQKKIEDEVMSKEEILFEASLTTNVLPKKKMFDYTE